MSDQWSHQTTVFRINDSLLSRGYTTWLDVNDMKGNTVDCMSHAIDCAALMLYTVSRSYKESANCRMELNYGLSLQRDQIPLMMERGYRPNGWL